MRNITGIDWRQNRRVMLGRIRDSLENQSERFGITGRQEPMDILDRLENCAGGNVDLNGINRKSGSSD